MTRFEVIKKMTVEQLGHYLCNLYDEIHGCDNNCPGYNHCYIGHTGTIQWLQEEENEGLLKK